MPVAETQREHELETSMDSLYGTGVVLEENSTAYDSTTREGIVGTVGCVVGNEREKCYCSGTLITPTVFISAGHCFEDPDGAKGEVITFAQSPNREFIVKEEYVYLRRKGSYDLTILTLETPVPSDIVQKPAPVWTGSTRDAIDRAEEMTCPPSLDHS